MTPTAENPRWASRVLIAAAVYNVAFGAFAVFFPDRIFVWTGLTPPAYPELWQCIGMIVGVYGVGYALAARDPHRHWPIVVVGLLGKVLGPLGFLGTLSGGGALSWKFGAVLLTNDLVWWIPFAAILRDAFRARTRTRTGPLARPRIREAMDESLTSVGWTLLDLSTDAPRLVIFLPGPGRDDWQDQLVDLQRLRPRIEEHGASLVFVHAQDRREGADRLARAGLSDAVHVSDPRGDLYRAFGLEPGTTRQSGAFLVFDGEILRSHRSSDAPDYLELARIRVRSPRWIRS